MMAAQPQQWMDGQQWLPAGLEQSNHGNYPVEYAHPSMAQFGNVRIDPQNQVPSRVPRSHQDAFYVEPHDHASVGGDVVQSSTEMSDGQEELLSMTMVVPDRATAGMKLRCTALDGQELRLTLPEGVPAGSVMTLTQDPESKIWKCMAEPTAPEMLEMPADFYTSPDMVSASMPAAFPRPGLEQPATQPALGPGHMPISRNQTMPHGQPGLVNWNSVGMNGPASSPGMNGPANSLGMNGLATSPPEVHRHSATPGSQVGPSRLLPACKPMPINLSYVPPPAPGHVPTRSSLGRGSQQEIRVAARPQPHRGPTRSPTVAAPPATLMTDPALFNPPRQYPMGGSVVEQRPSYTPPPVLERRIPSYTPPPQRPASYTPLPQVKPIERKPSYTPPQAPLDQRLYASVPQQLLPQQPLVPSTRPHGAFGMPMLPMGGQVTRSGLSTDSNLTASGAQINQGSLSMPKTLQGPTITTLPPQGQPAYAPTVGGTYTAPIGATYAQPTYASGMQGQQQFPGIQQSVQVGPAGLIFNANRAPIWAGPNQVAWPRG